MKRPKGAKLAKKEEAVAALMKKKGVDDSELTDLGSRSKLNDSIEAMAQASFGMRNEMKIKNTQERYMWMISFYERSNMKEEAADMIKKLRDLDNVQDGAPSVPPTVDVPRRSGSGTNAAEKMDEDSSGSSDCK